MYFLPPTKSSTSIELIFVSILSASNEGSIDMVEGEDYEVLELDQGDGWTRVRKANGEEGFVPTTYIECRYFDQ